MANNINMESKGTAGLPVDALGYIRYNTSEKYNTGPELYTEADIFAEAASNGSGGCNISFDAFFDIDFNLPDTGTFNYGFDSSFFDKTDAISLEFTMINDMLINSILAMECCDIAKVYNTTMVPFFQFFADSNNGGFMEMLVGYSKIIASLRAIVEPLDCLVRFVPGNPWLPVEVDPLAWIYGYFKESKSLLDRILSGEILDIILNPVHNMRQKLQGCLVSNDPYLGTSSIYDIGSQEQLIAISRQAISRGDNISGMKLPPRKQPVSPRASEYAGGSTSQEYKNALDDYNYAKREYDIDEKQRKLFNEEITRTRKLFEETNNALSVSSATERVIHFNTDGLCGCVLDAMNIDQVSVNFNDLRTTSDLNDMVGMTVSGVTHLESGTTSKDRPKDENITIQPSDINNPKATKAIIESGSIKGTPSKVTLVTKKFSRKNPYSYVSTTAPETIEFTVNTIKKEKTGATDTTKVVSDNDTSKKSIDELSKKQASNKNNIMYNDQKYKNNWLRAKAEAESYINNSSTGSIDSQVAKYLYNSYFTSFSPINVNNDPDDEAALGSYTTEDDFISLFPDGYFASSSDTITPYPKSTYVNREINSLDLSTTVDVDPRTNTLYFSAGFVKEGGSSSWLNFNKLNIPYAEDPSGTSVGENKSSVPFEAIYPNDTVGNQACIDYLTYKYSNTTLTVALSQELNNNTNLDVQTFMNNLTIKYNFINQSLGLFNDDELELIINEIADANDYTPGKLWLNSKQVSTELPETNTTYSYSSSGVTVPKTANAYKVREIINNNITERYEYYSKNFVYNIDNLSIDTALYDARSAIMASTISIPTEIGIHIPCTCDGILCAVLNTIIKYVMGALNRLIQELINMVTKFLVPDWLKDILRLIEDMSKCASSVFGALFTIQEINRYGDELLDAMRNRISYYPADACFVPDGIESILPSNYQDPEYPNEVPGSELDEPGMTDWLPGDTYIPGNIDPDDGTGNPSDENRPQDTTGGDDSGRCYVPPLLVHAETEILPGFIGGCLPTFKFKCSYLEI